MGDTDDGSDDGITKQLVRTVDVYEKRMPPTNDGRNTHEQVLQSIDWFKKYVYLPNKNWNLAKTSNPIWFYLDNGKEQRYNDEDSTSQVDDEDEELTLL